MLAICTSMNDCLWIFLHFLRLDWFICTAHLNNNNRTKQNEIYNRIVRSQLEVLVLDLKELRVELQQTCSSLRFVSDMWSIKTKQFFIHYFNTALNTSNCSFVSWYFFPYESKRTQAAVPRLYIKCPHPNIPNGWRRSCLSGTMWTRYVFSGPSNLIKEHFYFAPQVSISRWLIRILLLYSFFMCWSFLVPLFSSVWKDSCCVTSGHIPLCGTENFHTKLWESSFSIFT